MIEHVWLTADKPRVMLQTLARLHRHLNRPVSERKMRFFAYHGCRFAWAAIRDERSRTAIELGELALIERCTNDQFATAVEQAQAAYDDAAAAASGPYTREAYNAVQGAGMVLRAVLGVHMDNCIVKVRDAILFSESIAEQPENLRAEIAGLLSGMASALRDIFGNPFRPVAFSPEWQTGTAASIARAMYDSRDFGAMPILADALQDAGCDSEEILSHCRDPHGVHVRGCWVVDLVLGKA